MSAKVEVWDPYVRIFHWSLVASIALAWLAADEVKDVHEFAGYAAGALVASRLVMGLIGSRYARFSQFVRGPRKTIAYAAAMLRNREPRHMGHNPLGGLMILLLIFLVSLAGLTGWLQTTDAYWGVEWVSEAHEIVVNTLLVSIALHVFGVAVESVRHGENLALAMVTGRKRPPENDDIA
ncbi:Cytochrome B561 [Pseudorhizobium banfieldiae]|uniref:Cytochrome B561 n=1 Tax=Pseudorhizobium banfieldiae TaxID=1125847 RepID=L0NDI6_9HYPH|nr:cytochrome b/b6 domain-containing protein [Pseudorhizobium banfieldiae]CAD6602155.1 cytochrome b [arsenite-oxidising bacterium NT-25]CCF18377.1 Cytochrome B561 [Pseudorhizobium banfieldiae]